MWLLPIVLYEFISTASGFRKCYRFVYVNRNDTDLIDLIDLRRIMKDNFYWYRDVISSKGPNL
ncbi:glycosyl hydrolase family protein [Clostridium botulinum]|uniref:Glycosyl hydrolase family protein n=1 Tax=Clostridium botulinum TaxID=1491 RepID=A0A6B4CW42_CLOBO|nr:glycosyl hydrolase family protein [Clostridium botulinum]NFA07471.1 glycosyl hydrolase family protein [Clostridium botulinum]NFA24740.1 glycosyl hydrolase family protein [Clostridium botulinum]NFA33900.1 glycosyl hydrolase family protein [Clostridium botulinum]NFA80684.1 glycosyl hydrolase family protein [Clostridium botulinum]